MSNSGKIYWFGTYIYTAFGNQIESTDTENPFRYCGEYYDSETGLTYLRNRYYNSASGRFLNEDPIKDGLNWYVYCNNNPVMNVDPSGLERLDEDDINELRKKQQVVISEQEETIDIYLSLNFVYNMNFANIIAQSKEFEKAKNTVIEGMKNYWSGTFEYKRINIIIDDVTGDSMNEYKTIDVMIDLNNDNRSYTHIYNSKEQRKINNDRFYIKGIELNLKNMNSNQIKTTAGHELGHVFGIDDFYSIPDFFGIHSIMQNNDLGQTAYSLEFNLMFQSYIQNRFLFFNKSTYTPNSIIEKNRKMVKSFVK